MRTKDNKNTTNCDNDDYNCNAKWEYNHVNFYCDNKLHATLGTMSFISRVPKYSVKQRHDIKMAPACSVTDIELCVPPCSPLSD